MTVEELRTQLGAFDADVRVVVEGYEGGYDDPEFLVARVVLDGNWDSGAKPTGCFGRHEKVFDSTDGDVTAVILLGRVDY